METNSYVGEVVLNEVQIQKESNRLLKALINNLIMLS